jgi:pimeloyl-ACP methyl ester carboxylesterase
MQCKEVLFVHTQPFTVHVSEEILADLRQRLVRTRWPDEVAGASWNYGVPLPYMRELVHYWHTRFDWRAQERRINSLAQYRATIDGYGVHFVHERGKGPNPLPLLITHGWPSSFVEMLDLVPLLTDPVRFGGDAADAFDVIIPSLPGYGFSDRLTGEGKQPTGWAMLWASLMEGLGYARFGAHAGDIGASVTSRLALQFPERVVGYHTPEPSIMPGAYVEPLGPPLTDAERAYKQVQARFRDVEDGYAHIQATRPQTLAYGLNDSPAGLAAWIVDKWYSWTAPPTGDLEDHFTKDQLLTNIMIYWVTETINSANRAYYSDGHWRNPDASQDPNDGADLRLRVPVGVMLTATQPIERAPREYVERMATDIRRWVELPRGGHFIALEEPQLVADSIRAFFKELR